MRMFVGGSRSDSRSTRPAWRTGRDWAAIWSLEPVCQTVQRATGDMGAAVVSPSGIEDAMSGSIACVQQVLAVEASEGEASRCDVCGCQVEKEHVARWLLLLLEL